MDRSLSLKILLATYRSWCAWSCWHRHLHRRSWHPRNTGRNISNSIRICYNYCHNNMNFQPADRRTCNPGNEEQDLGAIHSTKLNWRNIETKGQQLNELYTWMHERMIWFNELMNREWVEWKSHSHLLHTSSHTDGETTEPQSMPGKADPVEIQPGSTPAMKCSNLEMFNNE